MNLKCVDDDVTLKRLNKPKISLLHGGNYSNGSSWDPWGGHRGQRRAACLSALGLLSDRKFPRGQKQKGVKKQKPRPG